MRKGRALGHANEAMMLASPLGTQVCALLRCMVWTFCSKMRLKTQLMSTFSVNVNQEVAKKKLTRMPRKPAGAPDHPPPPPPS